MKKEPKLPPLQEGLLMAMQAIDNQVARAMQRTPSQLEEHGVWKFEPYRERIERISGILLNALGEEQIQFDSLLVLTQALATTLGLVVEDLGEDGLGKVRAAYCRSVLEQLAEVARRGLSGIQGAVIS